MPGNSTMFTDEKMRADTRFVSGVQSQESGDFGTAEKLYSELYEHYPDNIELLQRIGYVLVQCGKINNARRYLERAVELQPADANSHYSLGVVEDLDGDQAAAVASLQRALTLQPDFYHAQNAIAEIMLPYENYMLLLKRFHQWLKPSNYVEIGVETGASIILAEPPTVCIGIDPNPQIQYEFSAPTQIFSETSDKFFENHDLREELNGQSVDLAFIDGLHHFEAALKDFINIERYSSKDTVVMIHDCIPLDRTTSARDRVTSFWSGDTWKIIPVLKLFRPDLNVITIPAPPTGLAVITGLDSASKVLSEGLDDIVKEYMPVDFDYLGQEKDDILNVIYDDWAAVQALIR